MPKPTKLANRDDTYLKMLKALFESGWTDEEVAIGIGAHMPGNRVPSSQSVFRWRRGTSYPDFYKMAIEALHRHVIEDGQSITITLPFPA